MKTINSILIIFMFAAGFVSCGLDNYDEPEIYLTGSVTYDGEPLQLRHSSVKFDLEQDAYELDDKIEVFISQDGTFSSLLFKGSYRFVPRPGTGPWVDGDPVEFELSEDMELEYAVTPYYVLRDNRIAMEGTELVSSCRIVPVVPERELESLTLYIGKTKFVDDRGGYNIGLEDFPAPVTGVNNLVFDITEILDDNPVLYARIGLKIQGFDERIFSEVVRIK